MRLVFTEHAKKRMLTRNVPSRTQENPLRLKRLTKGMLRKFRYDRRRADQNATYWYDLDNNRHVYVIVHVPEEDKHLVVTVLNFT